MSVTMKYTVGAALLGMACAVPIEAPWGGWSSGSASNGQPPATSTYSSPPTGTSLAASLKSGNPFSFPLPNGFPNLNQEELAKVNILAHGTQPDGGAPTLAADDLTSFQLIAFNEIFEVAFFTDLLFNVTNNVEGFEIRDKDERTTVINALTAIQAQEELHADNANAILKANNIAPIQACKYQFPTTSLSAAFDLASTFTDAVLGTLQDVQLHLAMNNDDGVVPIIGSVIGQEGEQNGFFRSYNGKIPSAKPFLTRATREFAFSALNQNFVVPNSCPNSNTIKLPIFQTLNVLTSPIKPENQTITYSVKADKSMPPSGASLVLINGQNIPLVQKIENAVNKDGVITFDAFFPFDGNVLEGFTIAALTSTAGPFTSAEDVAKVTIAGPGLIEVD